MNPLNFRNVLFEGESSIFSDSFGMVKIYDLRDPIVAHLLPKTSFKEHVESHHLVYKLSMVPVSDLIWGVKKSDRVYTIELL